MTGFWRFEADFKGKNVKIGSPEVKNDGLREKTKGGQTGFLGNGGKKTDGLKKKEKDTQGRIKTDKVGFWKETEEQKGS